MSGATNLIWCSCRPAPDPTTSKEAAAAAAAATVLATIDEKTAREVTVTLATYLASIPDDGSAKADGIRLGEAVAAKVLEVRAIDGHNALDDYRPRTAPGVYVPTSITAASTWSKVKPFALTAASQFRPDPPISLSSREWATDYNEIKDYGRQSDAKRSTQQTETARFWLMVGPPAYHPFVRQLVTAKQMSVGDSARLMALAAIGLNDALIAVFDAKYHYNFWRPITAIRNGDIDGNDLTGTRGDLAQPIDNTPMHPEHSMRPLHPQRRYRGCYQRQRSGKRGHSRDRDNKPHCTWRDPPLYQHDGLYR